MSEEENMIGKTVFVYQKFSGINEPTSPFKAIVEKGTLSMWKIYYYGTDDTLIKRSVQKACCSTKPVKKLKVPVLKERKKPGRKKRKIKRTKLKL